MTALRSAAVSAAPGMQAVFAHRTIRVNRCAGVKMAERLGYNPAQETKGISPIRCRWSQFLKRPGRW